MNNLVFWRQNIFIVLPPVQKKFFLSSRLISIWYIYHFLEAPNHFTSLLAPSNMRIEKKHTNVHQKLDWTLVKIGRCSSCLFQLLLSAIYGVTRSHIGSSLKRNCYGQVTLIQIPNSHNVTMLQINNSKSVLPISKYQKSNV